jgi:hypothetical protein
LFWFHIRTEGHSSTPWGIAGELRNREAMICLRYEFARRDAKHFGVFIVFGSHTMGSGRDCRAGKHENRDTFFRKESAQHIARPVGSSKRKSAQ